MLLTFLNAKNDSDDIALYNRDNMFLNETMLGKFKVLFCDDFN